MSGQTTSVTVTADADKGVSPPAAASPGARAPQSRSLPPAGMGPMRPRPSPRADGRCRDDKHGELMTWLGRGDRLSTRSLATRVVARLACYTARMRTEADIHERLTKLRGDLALLQEERRQLEQQIATPEWARRIPSLETQLAIVRRLIYTLEWVLNEHD